MVPLKYVRKETSRPSDSTFRTRAFTSDPGNKEPAQPPHGLAQRTTKELHTLVTHGMQVCHGI